MLFSIGISCWAPRVLFSFFPFGLFGRNKRKTIHFYKFTCLLFFFCHLVYRIIHTNERESKYVILLVVKRLYRNRNVSFWRTHTLASRFAQKYFIVTFQCSSFLVLAFANVYLVIICPSAAEARIGNKEQGTESEWCEILAKFVHILI